MQHLPIPAIHMEKEFGWTGKISGAESQGISKVSQTVLARLMVFQIRYPFAGSLALWGEGLEKRQWFLLALMPDTSVSPSMLLMPFKLQPWC